MAQLEQRSQDAELRALPQRRIPGVDKHGTATRAQNPYDFRQEPFAIRQVVDDRIAVDHVDACILERQVQSVDRGEPDAALVLAQVEPVAHLREARRR